MTPLEVAMTLLAFGWGAAAVWLNGERLRWRATARRLERQIARDRIDTKLVRLGVKSPEVVDVWEDEQ